MKSLNIIDHNPYLEVLQTKSSSSSEYEEFRHIAMVMDYTESKQMDAVLSGTSAIQMEVDDITEESVKEDPIEGDSPLDILRKMAEEEYLKRNEDDDDDEDDDEGLADAF